MRYWQNSTVTAQEVEKAASSAGALKDQWRVRLQLRGRDRTKAVVVMAYTERQAGALALASYGRRGWRLVSAARVVPRSVRGDRLVEVTGQLRLM